MAGKTLDTKKFFILFGPYIIHGYGKGTFIEIDPDDVLYTKETGGDGEVARSRSNNKSHRLKLTLMQTSSSNDDLSAAALADEVAPGGIVLPLTCKDLLGNTVFFATEAWISKRPNYKRSKNVEDNEWLIDTGSADFYLGGN